MRRWLLPAGFALVLCAVPLQAQEGPRRGKIKEVTADTITITVDGTDVDCAVTADTKIMSVANQPITPPLQDQGVKAGATVMFLARERDGKHVLVGLNSKLRPLTALGEEKYQDYEGGLYPEGKNERPAAHEAAGLALAKQVQPIDRDGRPNREGSIVLLSVGMSNTSQISQGFQKALIGEQEKNSRVVFVNGAQGGMTAAAIQDPADNSRGTQYWTTVDERLKTAGVTRTQVQVIWIKQADAGPTQGFPAYAKKLQEELARIVQLLPGRFPNIKLVYLSSRTYGGFAKTPLNPEPYAYESGFSVKWLIEQQLQGDAALNDDATKGPVKAPWLSWGPYLWDNGVVPRADGYRSEESDFGADGTHHAGPGTDKMGQLLLQFFKTDTTARPWFVRPRDVP